MVTPQPRAAWAGEGLWGPMGPLHHPGGKHDSLGQKGGHSPKISAEPAVMKPRREVASPCPGRAFANPLCPTFPLAA